MFSLPKLNYSYGDLEPFIDEKTMIIHHTKHHQAYIDNLNKALDAFPDLQKLEVEELLKEIDKVPSEIRQTVINNAGGHANHSFFWNVMSPKPGKQTNNFEGAINEVFGTLDRFKEDFTNKAMSVFGSGWCFLILDNNKKLTLKRHSFQNSPIMQGNMPILGIDLWEHAYYLKYQNRKKDYIDAWWNIVNWGQVSKNFELGFK